MLNQDNSQELPVSCQGRILCLTSSFPQSEEDNAGIFVSHLAQDLQKIGWKVDVLAPHVPGVPTHEVMKGVNVFRFRYLWPESKETVFRSGSAVVNLRNNPFNYLKIIPLVSFQGLATLQKLLGKKYDLIHTHWIIPQGFHGMLASLITSKPYVVTVHGGDVFSFKGLVMDRIKSLILRKARAVTVNSSFIKQRVKKIAPQQLSLLRIPMGVSFKQPTSEKVLQLRQQYKRAGGPLLLFVGRLVEAKGVGDFVKTVQLLSRDLPEVRALIVGDGQDSEHFVRYAHELEVNNRITFAGHVSPENVADYYSAADIFIGPSKKAEDGALEGLGMTFIEAMYANIPVIATKSGGIVDSVQHEKTGLLVNENSPDEIAVAVKRLLNDPELVKRIVEQGYAMATEKYSRQACAQKFSMLFKEILESS